MNSHIQESGGPWTSCSGLYSNMNPVLEKHISDAAELPPADLKLILLGDSAVGKSKLVERFLCNNYIERQLSTYALTMYRHNKMLEGQELKIDIWDTAGQECFNSLHPSYYYGAHACILVFDVTRKITYTNLRTWYAEMRRNCPHIPCILIANKIDVDLSVTKRQFAFSTQYQLPFYFVSAADGTNVVKVETRQIFEEALGAAMAYKRNPPDSLDRDIMELLQDDSWVTS